MAEVQDKQVKSSILIVDDEAPLLNILEQILKKHYDVRTATNGEEALQILSSGFKPGVILTDQRMPGMTGAEFLEKSLNIHPQSSRIILTGYTSPKDIIPCVNQGHAFMYLTKPAHEIQVIQAVKIGLDHYNTQIKFREMFNKLKQSVNELNTKNEELKVLLNENKSFATQAAQVLSSFINDCEEFYLTGHSQAVTAICKAMSSELKLTGESNANLILASLLIGIIYAGMPIKFRLIEPSELTDAERAEFLKIFQNNVSKLTKIKSAIPIVKLLSQIWERSDGTGFPNGLVNVNLERESSILAIANFYHNSVYRITYSDYQKFLAQGYFKQTPQQIFEKHNETIKLLYRKANWFDVDVFSTFQDIVKRKVCSALNPQVNTENLILENKNKEEINLFISNINNHSIETDESTRPKEKEVEKVIDVENLEVGMTVSRAVVTKSGMTICRGESTLDAGLVKNIKNMALSGALPPTIYIMID